MLPSAPLFAGVELGGTKCVCIVGSGPGDIRQMRSVETGLHPQATLRQIEQTLDDMIAAEGSVEALGIASFGPVDLDPDSQRFGFITSTPKPGWRDTNVATRLRDRFGLPMAFDTDVNAAALAEGLWGAAQGLDDFAYVTVGTGIGVGIVAGGKTIKGFAHPEAGHIRVARSPGDTWPGYCPFHGACVEGLASGPAIEARAGRPAAQIPADDPVWDLVAHTLGQLCATLTLTLAPKRILFGGGVLNGQAHLYGLIQKHFEDSLGGYLDHPQIIGVGAQYIRPAGLAELAGPLGALALAHGTVRS